MPLIKPRTRGKQMVRRIVRFDRETNETLFAYAHFLGESTDYVLNEVIDTVLAKDKEFLAWRAEHRDVVRAAVTGQPAGQEAPPQAPCRFAAVCSRVPQSHRRPRTPDGRVGRQATVIRMILEQRALVAMLIAMGVGAAGVHTYPVDRANVYLQIIELRNPAAFLVLVYGYAALWFTTPFFAASMLGSLTAIVAYRRPARAKQRALPAYVAPERRPAPTLVLGESHFETTNGPRTAALVADDSSARALHRRHGDRCRRHWQNVRVHVPVHRPTPPLEGQRSRAQDWRPCPRGQGRLLPAGARDARACRTRLGLHRDSPRRRHLLQPAPQRSRSVRRRLRHRDARQQPVRQVQGAVLAAGVHGSAQVRHPACGAWRTGTRRSPRSIATSSTDGKIDGRDHEAEGDVETAAGSDRRAADELRAAGSGDCGLEGLVPGRSRPHGAPVQRRPRIASGRSTDDSLRGSASAGDRVAGSQASARSGGPMVHVRLETTRQSPAVLDHRRHRRLPVAVRRQSGRPPDVLSATQRLRQSRRSRENRGRCLRSRNCSNRAMCWR